MARAKMVVGAHVICYVNGQILGRVTGFNFRSQTPRRALYGLDSLDPYELAVTTTKIVGTVNILKTVGDGGAEGAGFTSNFEDLSREKYFTIQIVDRSTDLILFQAEFCAVTAQSWDMKEKASVRGVIEFEALYWSNELKPLGESA